MDDLPIADIASLTTQAVIATSVCAGQMKHEGSKFQYPSAVRHCRNGTGGSDFREYIRFLLIKKTDTLQIHTGVPYVTMLLYLLQLSWLLETVLQFNFFLSLTCCLCVPDS
jgi:hypothetical protein